MAYLEGSQSIDNAATSVAVTFSPAFSAPPQVVIANIVNLTDSSPLNLVATVTVISASGFEVDLSAATDSANYEILWIAGDASVIYQAAAMGYRKASQLAVQGANPADNDFIINISGGRTYRLSWNVIYDLFARFIQTAPTAIGSIGQKGNVAIEGNYLYAHNGTSWGRITLNQLDWATSADAYAATQSGLEDIGDAEDTVTVSYPVPFTGVVIPKVEVSVENLVPGAALNLTAMVRARTLSGFTVQLSDTTDSANYKLRWIARQTPD